MVFAAYYMLPMVQRVLFNELDRPENRTFADLSRREMAILGPLVALMIWIGVHPTPFLQRMEPSVQVVLERVADARAVTLAKPDAAALAVHVSPSPQPVSDGPPTAGRAADTREMPRTADVPDGER